MSVIALERGCVGCPDASVIELRRDGSAIYTVIGNARHGTPDRVSRGTVSAADFDRLAQMAVSRGFFDMADTYEEAGLQDGPWTTTSVATGGPPKRVFRRDEAGPAGLKAIEAEIEAVKSRSAFPADRR